MTKEIILTQGKVAIVDDEDFEWLRQWKWRFADRYVVRTETVSYKSRVTRWIHRVIMDTPSDMYCDHINHNTLDNRKCNLRNVNRIQSSANRRIHSNNQSGYKGVVQRGSRYRATVDYNGRHVFCETFSSKEEAAKAYDHYARLYHGEYAVLNFPND